MISLSLLRVLIVLNVWVAVLMPFKSVTSGLRSNSYKGLAQIKAFNMMVIQICLHSKILLCHVRSMPNHFVMKAVLSSFTLNLMYLPEKLLNHTLSMPSGVNVWWDITTWQKFLFTFTKMITLITEHWLPEIIASRYLCNISCFVLEYPNSDICLMECFNDGHPIMF